MVRHARVRTECPLLFFFLENGKQKRCFAAFKGGGVLSLNRFGWEALTTCAAEYRSAVAGVLLYTVYFYYLFFNSSPYSAPILYAMKCLRFFGFITPFQLCSLSPLTYSLFVNTHHASLFVSSHRFAVTFPTAIFSNQPFTDEALFLNYALNSSRGYYLIVNKLVFTKFLPCQHAASNSASHRN